MTHVYFKGYKANYDYDKQDWFYVVTVESATENPRPCRKCGHHSLKDGDVAVIEAENFLLGLQLGRLFDNFVGIHPGVFLF